MPNLLLDPIHQISLDINDGTEQVVGQSVCDVLPLNGLVGCHIPIVIVVWCSDSHSLWEPGKVVQNLGHCHAFLVFGEDEVVVVVVGILEFLDGFGLAFGEQALHPFKDFQLALVIVGFGLQPL